MRFSGDILLRGALCALTLAVGAGAGAAPDGAALYAAHCSACHGDTGRGGVGVPLALPSFLDSVDDRFLRKTIRLGRPGRVMPAFPALSDAQVEALVGHLRAWSGRPAPVFDTTPIRGDPEHGRELYAKHCADCHGDRGQGGKGTGVTFSRKRDLPIVAPALSNPGFQAAASDQLIKHTLVYGRDGTPMSSFLVHGLSERDLDDIVAHVRTLARPSARPAGELETMLSVDSPYDFGQTVENVKQAIEGHNFRLIRVQPLEEGLAAPGEEAARQQIVYFCNFGFLFDALAIDPRIGMFLPCRLTVLEQHGRVRVVAINPLRLSVLFNNDELDEACRTMHDIYRDLLDEVAL